MKFRTPAWILKGRFNSFRFRLQHTVWTLSERHMFWFHRFYYYFFITHTRAILYDIKNMTLSQSYLINHLIIENNIPNTVYIIFLRLVPNTGSHPPPQLPLRKRLKLIAASSVCPNQGIWISLLILYSNYYFISIYQNIWYKTLNYVIL